MSKASADEGFLRGVTGPAHWSEADARRVLALCDASGESTGNRCMDPLFTRCGASPTLGG